MFIVKRMSCIIYSKLLIWNALSTLFSSLRFAGMDVKQYRYYDKSTCGFDEKGALEVSRLRYMTEAYEGFL